jgi:EKC/KEOPS complex subunit PCC1/LAGE3
VRRAFSLAKPEPTPQVPAEGSTTATNGVAAQPSAQGGVEQAKEDEQDKEYLTVLRTEYKATTNRMLRVAVNSFMDSLAVVLNVMEELDVDVLAAELGR